MSTRYRQPRRLVKTRRLSELSRHKQTHNTVASTLVWSVLLAGVPAAIATLFAVLVTSLPAPAIPLAALACSSLLAIGYILIQGLVRAAHTIMDALLKGTLHPVSPSFWYHHGADLSAMQLLSIEGDTKTASQLGKIPGLYFNNDYFRRLLTDAESAPDTKAILGALDTLNAHRELTQILCRITQAVADAQYSARSHSGYISVSQSRQISGLRQEQALEYILQMADICLAFGFDPAAVRYASSLAGTVIGSIAISPPSTPHIEFEKLLATIRRLLLARSPVPALV